MADRPSLFIGFGASRTRARLEASEDYRSDISRLSLSFPGSQRPAPATLELPLEELLADITVLASWPDPAGIQWEDGFREAVASGVRESNEVQERIAAGTAPAGEVGADEVRSLLGSNWTADLTAFQLRDIAQLLSMAHGANFSVPGAGKTRTVCALYAARQGMGRIQRVLVVAPKSAFESWTSEIATCFADPPNTVVVDGAAEISAAEVLIVNYERLPKMTGILARWIAAAPAMLVLDEAHRMKLGLKGAYGAACMELGPLAESRTILTGTPAPNGPKDLENLLSFVWPGQGRRRVQEAVDGGDLAHASSVLRPLFSRTTKEELGLPKVNLAVRYVDLPPLHHEIYAALCGKFSARAASSQSDFDAIGKSTLRMIMAATSPALLLESTSPHEPLEHRVPALSPDEDASLISLLHRLPEYEMSEKYSELLAIVAANRERGRKTLVWSTFVRNLATAGRVLSGFSPAVVHGGVPDREDQIARFRSDPDCWVLLSNPATLGEGISLHRHCNDAVYLDRDFIAGRYMQSLDRIHRLGLPPDTETNVTVLAARGTIDEVVAVRLQEKLEFMGTILDDPAVLQLADPYEEPSQSGWMDESDIRALLEHAARHAAGPK